MSVIGSNILAGASGQGGDYTIARSLRFRSSASAYLNRTPANTTNQKTWTLSIWFKRGVLSTTQKFFSSNNGTNNAFDIGFSSAGQLQWEYWDGANNYYQASNAVYRDPSAWYHFVIAVDTTQATASNRTKFYFNGLQVTSLATDVPMSQDLNTQVNSASCEHRLSRGGQYSSQYFDGYMTEINFIDGQALTPSSFGETNASTGVWQPKKYAGTYGTNGFYLPFTDNSALTSGSNAGLGKDFSGNGNYWNTNNISITSGSTYDSMTDVPTLTSATAANFPVMNPLNADATNATMSSGNLNFSGGTSGIYARATFGANTGKFYSEVIFTTISGATSVVDCGIISPDGQNVVYYKSDGNKGLTSGESSYGATYTTNNVIGIAVDFTNKNITFYKDNTSQGQFSFTAETWTGDWVFYARTRGTTTYAGNINFGQRPFAYTPPTGYVALNTFNLPTPTIGATASTQADDYFNISLYSGNASTQVITNSSSMQPDFVWIKERSSTSSHVLSDSVRGAGNILSSNTTDAESTGQVALTSFNSNGFTVGDDGKTNESGQTYVGWQWKANGTGVTNTAGSITSTVSANTSAGFSVVTYTGNGSAGATVGHGLGVAPSMIIGKSRDSTEWWNVYHASLGNTKALFLQSTSGAATNSYWNNTSPTSSVFSLGSSAVASLNVNGEKVVAYCFSAIAGYSAIGSYVGNGSADGVFVYTGFRPKYILQKNTSTAGTEWLIFDATRSPYNATQSALYANLSNAEATFSTGIDILSNGFKFRQTASDLNASGATYIYYAVAENPFKYSLGR